MLLLLSLLSIVLPSGLAHAQDRIACPAPEARQFDFWIGEWEVRNQHRDPSAPADTTWYDTGTAVDLVYAILGGCAIVEHWEGHLTYDHVLGFSVRAWDPEAGTWTILLDWPGPQGPGFSTLEGGFENGVGTFERAVEGPDGTPARVRFRFSSIGPRSLRWDGARSTDGGETWRGFWRMDFSRRDPIADRALLHATSRRVAPRCDRDRAREFDFLVGDWSGEEATVADGGATTRPVGLQAWSILEGCAIMELGAAGEPPVEERFRVRSFVPSDGRWIQYGLERGDPVFERWEGAGERVLIRADGDRLERVRWTDVGTDSFRRAIDRSTDGGKTWSTVSRATFERRGSGEREGGSPDPD